MSISSPEYIDYFLDLHNIRISLGGIDMASIRMIATDLDGTLLNSEGIPSQENVIALKQAIDRGIIVTISTGRMFSSSAQFARMIGITAPMICYNGGLIINPINEEWLHHSPLDHDFALEVLSHLRKEDVCVQTYINDILHIRDKDIVLTHDYEQVYGIVGVPAGDDLYTPTTSPTKILVLEENAEKALNLELRLRSRFGDRAYIARSSAQFVEIMDLGTNKGVALQSLAASLNIPMSETLALGDGGNDVEMLRAAGLGIAVGNGSDAAKDAADIIGPGNDEHLLAWAVEKYVLTQNSNLT